MEPKYSGGIVGKWKLVEVYADPGDGSGKFRKIDSKKTITFTNDGKVKTTNGELCMISAASTESQSSFYTLINNTDPLANSVPQMKIEKCQSTLNYSIQNDVLTIYYQCIEGCGEKFERVN